MCLGRFHLHAAAPVGVGCPPEGARARIGVGHAPGARRIATAARGIGLAILVAAGGIGAATAWADTAELALGKALFTRLAVPSCAVCHTLKDAGSEGAIGPVLDELKPDATRVATALRNGIGQMPSFAGQLTEAQIQALAAYVSAASAGQ